MWTQEQINEWREYLKAREDNVKLQKTYNNHLRVFLKAEQKALDSGTTVTIQEASEPPNPPPNPPGPPPNP